MTGTQYTQELACRSGDGVEVALFWSPTAGASPSLSTMPGRIERFELSARADNALDVFYHPYAYLSSPTELAA